MNSKVCASFTEGTHLNTGCSERDSTVQFARYLVFIFFKDKKDTKADVAWEHNFVVVPRFSTRGIPMGSLLKSASESDSKRNDDIGDIYYSKKFCITKFLPKFISTIIF